MVIPNSVGLQVTIFSYSIVSLKPTLKLALYIIWHENFNFLRLQVVEGQVFIDKVYFTFYSHTQSSEQAFKCNLVFTDARGVEYISFKKIIIVNALN